MPRVGRRELQSLGINTSTPVENMAEEPATTVATTVEVFEMNPFAVDINPTTSEGSKLYLKATEQWSTKDRLSLTIENGPKIREVLDGLRSRFAWGRLISRITDEHGIMKDAIKNYRNLKAAGRERK